MNKGNLTTALFTCALLSTGFVATTLNDMAIKKPSISRSVASEEKVSAEVGFEATGPVETEAVVEDLRLPVAVSEVEVDIPQEHLITTPGKIEAAESEQVSVDEHALLLDGKLAAMSAPVDGEVIQRDAVEQITSRNTQVPVSELKREEDFWDSVGRVTESIIGEGTISKFFKGEHPWQIDARDKRALMAMQKFVTESDEMKDLNISKREDVVKGLKEFIEILNKNEKEVNQTLVDIASKVDEIEKLKKDLETNIEENAETINAKNIEIAELKQAIADLEKLLGSKAEMEAKVEALEKENQELKIAVENEKAVKECYADKASKLEEELKAKTSELEKLAARVEKLEEGKSSDDESEKEEKKEKKSKKKENDSERVAASRDEAYANHILGLLAPVLQAQQQMMMQYQLNSRAEYDNRSVVASLMGSQNTVESVIAREMLKYRALDRLGDIDYRNQMNSIYRDSSLNRRMENWYGSELHIDPAQSFHSQYIQNSPMLFTPDNALQLNQLSLHGGYNWSPLGTTSAAPVATAIPLGSSQVGDAAVPVFSFN